MVGARGTDEIRILAFTASVARAQDACAAAVALGGCQYGQCLKMEVGVAVLVRT